MRDHRYPEPPRSACTFCPFHDASEWLRLKASPEWPSIVQFEKDLQAAALKNEGPAKMKGTPYLHNSCVPIDEVDFEWLIGDGDRQGDMFADECSGMCGV